MEEVWSGLEKMLKEVESEIAELRGRLDILEPLRDSAKKTIEFGRAWEQRRQPIAGPTPGTQGPREQTADAAPEGSTEPQSEPAQAENTAEQEAGQSEQQATPEGAPQQGSPQPG